MKEIKDELQRRFEQRRTFRRQTWAGLVIKIIALLAIIIVFRHFIVYREVSFKNMLNSHDNKNNEVKR